MLPAISASTVFLLSPANNKVRDVRLAGLDVGMGGPLFDDTSIKVSSLSRSSSVGN
ncbi:hypothetical protein D3C78_1882540 [compost metagenome]